jgi:hypothetical protein
VAGVEMTREQIYHRRLARTEGKRAIMKLFWRPDDPDYRGAGSAYAHAKSAAWHAFRAHPELRERVDGERAE